MFIAYANKKRPCLQGIGVNCTQQIAFWKTLQLTRVRSPTPPIIIYSTMHMHAWFSRCILHVHTKNVFLLAWAKLQTTGRCFVKNSELMSELRKVASGCSWAIGYGIDKIRCGPVAPAKKSECSNMLHIQWSSNMLDIHANVLKKSNNVSFPKILLLILVRLCSQHPSHRASLFLMPRYATFHLCRTGSGTHRFSAGHTTIRKTIYPQCRSMSQREKGANVLAIWGFLSREQAWLAAGTSPIWMKHL